MEDHDESEKKLTPLDRLSVAMARPQPSLTLYWTLPGEGIVLSTLFLFFFTGLVLYTEDLEGLVPFLVFVFLISYLGAYLVQFIREMRKPHEDRNYYLLSLATFVIFSVAFWYFERGLNGVFIGFFLGISFFHLVLTIFYLPLYEVFMHTW